MAPRQTLNTMVLQMVQNALAGKPQPPSDKALGLRLGLSTPAVNAGLALKAGLRAAGVDPKTLDQVDRFGNSLLGVHGTMEDMDQRYAYLQAHGRGQGRPDANTELAGKFIGSIPATLITKNPYIGGALQGLSMTESRDPMALAEIAASNALGGRLGQAVTSRFVAPAVSRYVTGPAGKLTQRVVNGLIAPRVAREAGEMAGAAAPKVLYRGGAPFDPAHPGPSFFSEHPDVAASYKSMHEDQYPTPGVVQRAHVAIKNPAPEHVVLQEAKKLGIDTAADHNLTSNAFHRDLYGDAAGQLAQNLKAQGYDGTILPDMAYGSGRFNSELHPAHIPFDNASQVHILPEGEQLPNPGRRALLKGAAALPVAAAAAKVASVLPAAAEHAAPTAVAGAKQGVHALGSDLNEYAAQAWARYSQALRTNAPAEVAQAALKEAQDATNMVSSHAEYHAGQVGADTLAKTGMHPANAGTDLAGDIGNDHFSGSGGRLHGAAIDPVQDADAMTEIHLANAADYRKAMGPYANSPLSGQELESALQGYRDNPAQAHMNMEEGEQYGRGPFSRDEAGHIANHEEIAQQAGSSPLEYTGQIHPLHPSVDDPFISVDDYLNDNPGLFQFNHSPAAP